MIVVYGTVCLDRIRSIEALPAPGRYAEVLEESWALGGEAANTAFALRRWGHRAVLVGNPIGRGPEAELLRRLLQDKGLGDALLPEGEGPAPVTDVYVTLDGTRTMFGLGFSALEELARPEELPLFAGAWLAADPNHGRAARRAALRAREAGMRLYLMDFLRPEDPEAEILQTSTDWAGRPGDREANLRAAAERALRAGVVLLTDGERGVTVGARGADPVALPAFPAPRVADTTGAGDLFRAGVLARLEEGADLTEALAFAAAAAALKVAHRGATEGVPSREEVEAHRRSHPEVEEAYLSKRGALPRVPSGRS